MVYQEATSRATLVSTSLPLPDPLVPEGQEEELRKVGKYPACLLLGKIGSDVLQMKAPELGDFVRGREGQLYRIGYRSHRVNKNGQPL